MNSFRLPASLALVASDDCIKVFNDVARIDVQPIKRTKSCEVFKQAFQLTLSLGAGLCEILTSPIVDFSRSLKERIALATEIFLQNVF